MHIIVGCDHAGYALAGELISFLEGRGISVLRLGAQSGAPCDYVDVAADCIAAYRAGDFQYIVLVCGTGVGMSMAANKHDGMRAALVHDTFSARAARAHNNANVLCLGSRVVGAEVAKDIAYTFLFTDYPGEPRHAKRVAKLGELDKNRHS